MKDYVSGAMTNEEAHALEVHLNSCPFCSEAIEGMLSLDPAEVNAALNDLNAGFLKEHLSDNNTAHSAVHHPSPATGTHARPAETKKKTIPLWRTVSIAAALLLFLGILWYNIGYRQPETIAPLADKTALPEPAKPLVAANNAATALHDQPNNEALLAAKQKQPVPETVKATKSLIAPAAPATTVNAGMQADATQATDANAGKKEAEEAVVTSYKVPLIDKFSPAPANTAKPEQVERTATRNTESVAAASDPSAARVRLGNSADEETRNSGKENKKEKAAIAAANEPDNIDEGNKLYAQKRYSAAVNVFQKEFSNTDKSRRHEAMLMAARCYLNMGNKDKATQLLQNIIEEGGAKKRDAKKLLNVLSD